MKVLVTGGAGFIGSNLCEHLLREGHTVRCLDNFATGKPENIIPLLEMYPETFQLQVGDIRNLADCQKAVDGMESVLHEAALGSVPRSIKDPITTNEVNIGGFLNMIVASRDAGIKRFVFAASSSTYGDSQSLPKVENVIGKPLSPYAITKYVDELYADVFHNLYGIDCIGLRYFNVFGPRQDPKSAYAAAVPIFLAKALANEPLTIFGDGEQTRDFIYVKDIVAANVFMATHDFTGVYNVAYGGKITINDLAKEIIRLTGSRSEILHQPERPGDVKHSMAAPDKLMATGFKPSFSFAEGMAATVAWFRANR